MKFFSIIFLLFLAVSLLFNGCGKNDDTKQQTKKDSLELIPITQTEVQKTEPHYPVNRDSTDIYGTGNFLYKDTLDSFHKGYSIPRDSVYKVYNTKAFKDLDELIRKHPKKPGPYLDRGNHFQNIKMYPEAIQDYNMYIKMDPYNQSAYMNRGNAYERLKYYDSAMWDYQKVLELKPNDTIANFNKGNIYDILEKFDLAVKEYDTVLVKDVHLAKAYYNRGTSYLNLRNYQAAVNDWEEAIKLNPNYEADLRPRINKIKPLLK